MKMTFFLVIAAILIVVAHTTSDRDEEGDHELPVFARGFRGSNFRRQSGRSRDDVIQPVLKPVAKPQAMDVVGEKESESESEEAFSQERRHGYDGFSSFIGGSFSGGSHSGRLDPNLPLDCSAAPVKCTPKRHHRGVAASNSGVRVCLQDPYDDTNSVDVCMNADDVGNTAVFSDLDRCGCCGGECPKVCTACPCTGIDRYGDEFSGFYMNVVHHHRRLRGRRLRHGPRNWSRSGSKIIACVPVGKTIDKQLRDGACLEQGACPSISLKV